MTLDESHISELRQAYAVLGVQPSSSALVIKQAYRRLAKRWHPDLYPAGTPAQSEAAQMMKLINEAYTQVEHAPLRYHFQTDAEDARRQSRRPFRKSDAKQPAINISDRLEFLMRFAVGTVIGALISFRLSVYFRDLSGFIPVALLTIIVFGFATARWGDKFWRAVFRTYYLWS